MKEKITLKKLEPIIFLSAILAIVFAENLRYVLSATTNVPVMDHWRYIALFGEKLMEGDLTLADLWTRQMGTTHRHVGIGVMLFLFNFKYLGYNTRFEIIGGVVVRLILCLVLMYIFMKKMNWKNNLEKCGFLFLILCVFNINQWEILTLEFSMSFAIRSLSTLMVLHLFDNLQKHDLSTKKRILQSVIMCVLPCMMGSYAPAVLATLIFITVIQMVVTQAGKLKVLKYNLPMIAFFSLRIMFYHQGSSEIVASSGSSSVLKLIMDGRLFKSIFSMLGASIIHISSEFAEKSAQNVLYVGVVLFVMYFIAIYLFFKRKMHKMTYIPLMLMGYTAASIIMISVGRVRQYGVSYMLSSRYVCETTLGLIGLIWIYWHEICIHIRAFRENTVTSKKASVLKMLPWALSIFMIVNGFIISHQTEIKIAPYRKIYQENIAKNMTEEDELSDSEIAAFQSERGYVEEGIEVLKRYKRGIFRE